MNLHLRSDSLPDQFILYDQLANEKSPLIALVRMRDQQLVVRDLVNLIEDRLNLAVLIGENLDALNFAMLFSDA